MTVRAEQKAVTTTAAVLAAAGSTVQDKKTVALTGATGTIYIGGPDVDTTEGFPITTTSSLVIELGPGDALWAVAASTLAVNVLETRAN